MHDTTPKIVDSSSPKNSNGLELETSGWSCAPPDVAQVIDLPAPEGCGNLTPSADVFNVPVESRSQLPRDQKGGNSSLNTDGLPLNSLAGRPRNPMPEVFLDISPLAFETDRLSRDVNKSVIAFLTTFMRGDKVLQSSFKNFCDLLRPHFNTKRGAWYRVAYVWAIRETRYAPVPIDLGRQLSFVTDVQIHRIFRPIFVLGLVQAVALSDQAYELYRFSNSVHPVDFIPVVNKLVPLMAYNPKFFVKDCYRICSSTTFISMNILARAFAQQLKRGFEFAVSEKNNHFEICRRLGRYREVEPFLKALELDGVCEAFDFPVREFGSHSTARSLAAYNRRFHNQMFNFVKKAADIPSKVDQSIDLFMDSVEELTETAQKAGLASEKISEAITTLTPRVAETTEQVGGLFEKLNKILEPAYAAMAAVSDSFEKVKNALQFLWDFLKKHVKIAFPLVSLILVGLLRPYLNATTTPIVITILGLISLVLYGPSIKASFEKIYRSWIGTPDWENQAISDTAVLLSTVYCALGVNPNNKKDVIDLFKSIPSMSKGAEMVAESLYSVFVKLASWTSSIAGVDQQFAGWISEKYAAWHKQTLKFMSEQKSGTLDTTQLGSDSLEAHIATGIELAAEFDLMNKRAFSVLVVQSVRVLQTIHAELNALIRTGPKDRVEPVCAVFCGDPGAGKSTVVLLLADLLMRKMYEDSPPMLEQYLKNPKRFINHRGSEKWFESYDPATQVLIRDEFPLTKEMSPDDSPQVQLIDEVNKTSKPIPMANADLKGKITFNHSYSLITSNLTDFHSEMLMAPEAMKRRLHVVLFVSSKGNVSNHVRGGEIDPANWVFTLMTPDLGKAVSFSQTTIQLSFYEVATLLAGMQYARRVSLRADNSARDKMMETLPSTVDEKLVQIAKTMFRMQHKREPDNVELITVIRENLTVLETLGVKTEALEKIRESVGESKGKRRDGFVNQAIDDFDEFIPRNDPQDEPPLDTNEEAKGGYNSLPTKTDVPSLETGIDLIHTSLASGIDKIETEAEMFYFLRRMEHVPNGRFVADFLAKTILAEISYLTFPNDLEGFRVPLNNVSLSAGFQNTSSQGYKAMKLAQKLVYKLHVINGDLRIKLRLELAYGIIFSYGRVRLLGCSLPWVETYSKSTMDIVRPIGVIDDGKRVHSHQHIEDISTDGLTTVARLVSSFLRIMGYDKVFGIGVDSFARRYYSDTGLIVGVVEIFSPLGKSLNTFARDLLTLVKDYFAGSVPDPINHLRNLLVPALRSGAYETFQRLDDACNGFFSESWAMLKSACEMLRENWKYFVGAIGVLAVAVSTYKMFTRKADEEEDEEEYDMPPASFFDDFENQTSSERYHKYIQNNQKRNVKRPLQNRNAGPVPHQILAHNAENVYPVIVHNYWAMMTPTGRIAGHWLFIGRKRAIAPAHFLKYAEEHNAELGYYIRLKRGDQSFEFTKNEIRVVANYAHDARDLCIVDFCKDTFPQQRDIQSYFVSPKEEGITLQKGIFRIELITPTYAYSEEAYNQESFVRREEGAHLASEIFTVDDGRRVNTIVYPITTVNGDCGSVVVRGSKILGIHTAGNGNWGSAARINKFMLESSYIYPMEKDVEPASQFPEFEYDRNVLVTAQLYDETVHEELIVDVLSPPMSTFTKPHLREWNPNAELQPTVGLVRCLPSNFPQARAKITVPNLKIDREVADHAISVYKRFLLSHKRPTDICRNLTMVEAVAGVPDTGISSLDQSSSPGFPYNYLKIDRGRIYRIDERGKFVPGEFWPDICEHAKFMVRMMCHDFMPMVVFTDALKMETRAFEKLDKPRLIGGAPLVHTIASRAHFGAFMDFMSKNFIVNDMLLSFDPHKDWDQYERRKLALGDDVRVCCGDYKAFDGNRDPSTMEFVATIANAFYGDDDDSPIGKVRHALIRTSIVAAHAYGKNVELRSTGWSSGSLLTGLGNSMFNTWTHIYSCGVVAKERGMDWKSVLEGYFANVLIKVMGDDSEMAVSEEYSFHNNATHAKVMGEHLDLVYTSAKKSVDVVPFDPPEDRSLLKRRAVWCERDSRYYGALELETILNMVCFTKKGDEIAVMRQRGDNAIKELAFHPEEVWKEYLPKILAKLGPYYIWRGYTQDELRRLAAADWSLQSLCDGGFRPDSADKTCALPVTAPHVVDNTSPEAAGLGLVTTNTCNMITMNKSSNQTSAGRVRTLLEGFQSSPKSTNRRALTKVGDLGINKMSMYGQRFRFSTVNQMDKAGDNEVVPPSAMGVTDVVATSDSSQNPTTHFADDSIGFTGRMVATAPGDDSFVYELTANSSQTVVDFLRRPTLLTTGVFTASDSGILYSTDITNVINNNKIPKMSNIYTFKADFQVTLQVNADRFQQGRYILGFLPNGGVNAPGEANQLPLWRNMHTCNTTKITQLPHVEIDLATQTNVSLYIPFTSAYPMFSWSTANSSMLQSNGLIFLYPYSALNPGSGGSTNCGFSLFASLENVQIGSASYNQMDTGTKEAKAQGVGPVTKFFGKVADTASVMGSVPVLGALARDVSWASRLMAKASSIWGFSKPLAVAAPQRMIRNVAPFNAVSDVAHYAKPLGMMAENSVAIPPSVPSNVDEMALDFIKKVPAYLTQFTWPSSATAGTLLWSFLVSPNGSNVWSKGITHTPTSFINQQFFRWRGAMAYRFKLVKTQFHRGRLLVSFFPGVTNSVSFAGSEFVYREVVDVSQTGEFEVCCPYLVPNPWSNNTAGSGYISVHVLDPLVAPSSVATSVSTLVESFGGDDLQWSVPVAWAYEPYAPSTAQMAESYVTTPCFTLGPKITSPNDALTKFTSGEAVKSVRQLIKRQWKFNGANYFLGGANILQLYPYAIYPVTQATGTGGVLYRDTLYSDPINLWACAYVFSYGSIRYVARPPENATSLIVETSAIPGGATKTSVYSSTSGYGQSTFLTFSAPSIEGVVEVQSPNWNTSLGRPTPTHFVNNTQALYMSEPSANCTNVVFGDNLAAANYQIGLSRAAGEDFGYGLFIGVPPVVSTATT